MRFSILLCFLWFIVFFVLWFLCCGMFAFVFRSRRGEDERGDSFQEEGGIADVVEPDRVTDVM